MFSRVALTLIYQDTMPKGRYCNSFLLLFFIVAAVLIFQVVFLITLPQILGIVKFLLCGANILFGCLCGRFKYIGRLSEVSGSEKTFHNHRSKHIYCRHHNEWLLYVQNSHLPYPNFYAFLFFVNNNSLMRNNKQEKSVKNR